jgi:hypothetical protein
MEYIRDKWRALKASIDDTTATIRTISEVVGLGSVIIVVIGKWLATLNDIQRNALWAAGGCLVIIIVTYIADWQKKRAIDKIPELLAKMDSLILDYFDNGLIFHDTPMELLEDLAKLMNFNINELKTAATSGNKHRAEQEFSRFADAHSKRFNSKNFAENILNLRLAGALMNEYNTGLIVVTRTKEYQDLYQQVRYLRKRLPAANVNKSINEYFHQSEGLYSLLFSIQPFANLGIFRDIIPVKIRAYSDVVRPIVEGHLASLIISVRESISDYKHKYTISDNTKKQSK